MAIKLSGLKPEEKRWRALTQRLSGSIAARLPGAERRFRRALEAAVTAEPSDGLRYAVPFLLAERALGAAAIIEADPHSIGRWLISEAKSGGGLELPRDHFLIDGNWWALTQPLERSGLDEEVRDLIACGGDYRQTRLHGMLTRRLAKERTYRRNGVVFRSPADIELYCEHHLQLIDSIRKHGVVRRAQLAGIGIAAGRSTPNAAFLERVETDAGVAVGPNGKLLRYRGGFHRTAAARELGLARMPVQVKLVHLGWLRKVIAETGLAPHDALIMGLRRLSVATDAHDIPVARG